MLGIDIAPNLLEQARQGAVAESLGATFEEGDTEQLPYPDGHFDVVASMFEPCSPQVQNTGMIASILTSIISAREDLLFTSRSGRSDI